MTKDFLNETFAWIHSTIDYLRRDTFESRTGQSTNQPGLKNYIENEIDFLEKVIKSTKKTNLDGLLEILEKAKIILLNLRASQTINHDFLTNLDLLRYQKRAIIEEIKRVHKIVIGVCSGMACNRSENLLAELLGAVVGNKLEEHVFIHYVSCLDACKAGPCAIVETKKGGISYCKSKGAYPPFMQYKVERWGEYKDKPVEKLIIDNLKD